MEPEVSEIFDKYAIDVVRQWSNSAQISSSSEINSDLSLRRFVRLTFVPGSAPVSSAVLMYYIETKSAEAGGKNDLPANEAFVSLAPTLKALGVAVPEIYADLVDRKLTLVEDLGELTLGTVIEQRSLPVDPLLQTSIDQIIRLQSADRSTGCFAFERYFSLALFIKETTQYVDYALSEISEPHSTQIRSFLAWLSTTVSQRNKTLVHRDFHPWNILVKDGEIRVIDFQDALIGPVTYDLISLLNDRDVDSLIGKASWDTAVEYFFDATKLGDYGREDFLLCSLVRDFKVVGLFIRSKELRGLDRYMGWVPGTERRLGRNMKNLEDSGLLPAEFSGLSNWISELRSDFKVGYVGS